MTDVAAVIAALDGAEKSLAVFESAEPGTYLAVGGGPEQFVVLYNEGNAKFALAVWPNVAPESAGDPVQITVGGQPQSYERRFLVDARLATAAAGRYRQDNKLDPSIEWVWS